MNTKRNKDSNLYEDGHAIKNLEYNEAAGAKKTVEVGGALEYLGAVDAFAGMKVEAGAQLYILNLSGALGYIAISDAVIGAAPAAPAEGIFPVFDSGEFTAYSTGSNTNIRTSVATLHVYKLVDSTVVRVNP
tara:strand:- start:7974 stop:8369 length:396 start_codon:yes stop_codon:yes gene_type:complete